MDKRIHYIDNLRWLTVSLLIVFHAAMAYNTWDEANYIFMGEARIPAAIVTFIVPWFMPLMFLLAGVSANFSIGKRGYKTFIKERLVRLGIPLIFGVAVIAPVLTFIADRTHNGYGGSFFEHYTKHFTEFGDLTGYDGKFTLGHLWFIAVLIVISLIACPVTAGVRRIGGRAEAVAGTIFAVAAIATYDIKYGGKPMIMYLCVFMTGYFIYSRREFADKAAKFKWPLAAAFIASSIANAAIFIYIGGHGTLNNICYCASFALGVPALMAIGHDHLERRYGVTILLSRISYVFYIIHFPIVVVCQYMLDCAGVSHIANFPLTILICYPITYALCCLIDRAKGVRVLFGLKK